ncbi:MAG: ornithine carbamoyltransferase [Polyangiaceae bacterium]
MSKRDFLRIGDLNIGELRRVLALARVLKSEAKGTRTGTLAGKAIAVVMEKPSTRTRVSFEVGAAQLGAHPVVLTTAGSQLARGEPVRDTARVLSGYCDMIVYRTFGEDALREMAEYASVPVINALSDEGHPVQVLCDVFTIEEALGRSIEGLRCAWVGDGSSNMARSFVEAARIFNFHLALAAPEGYLPPDEERAAAIENGCLSIHTRPEQAMEGAAAVSTDVWTSMGQEAEQQRRLSAFKSWTLDEHHFQKAAPGAIVLHCLPAHRGEEISAELFEGARSVVWAQAENRLHVQKALMLFLLGHG